MGAGILPLLESRVAGADPYNVEGKFLARHFAELNAMAGGLEVKSISELGEPDAMPGRIEEWFPAEEGVATIDALASKIREDQSLLEDSEHVLYDLEDCKGVLGLAAAAGVKFRFTMLE